MVMDGTLVKVVAWYDNEWGYSCRLGELAEKVSLSRQPAESWAPRAGGACSRRRPSGTSTSSGRRALVRVDFNVPLEAQGRACGGATTRGSGPRCRRSTICASAGPGSCWSRISDRPEGPDPGAVDGAGVGRGSPS